MHIRLVLDVSVFKIALFLFACVYSAHRSVHVFLELSQALLLGLQLCVDVSHSAPDFLHTHCSPPQSLCSLSFRLFDEFLRVFLTLTYLALYELLTLCALVECCLGSLYMQRRRSTLRFMFKALQLLELLGPGFFGESQLVFERLLLGQFVGSSLNFHGLLLW